MTGYNVSWAAFAIVEVMSQARFAHKRIGCLAANQVGTVLLCNHEGIILKQFFYQSFDETTDVILLTTNLFKKEFTSISMNNQYEIGLAINCLANIATKDLARDCISDLVTLMNHSKPYIRKKAVLAMYKLYVKFPQGLRLTFDKLKERLDDAESSVVSTAVNVICELANKNAKNYLAMAPKFFKLLTSSSNNWMLIKVVKLLGSLVSEEPRLARKLLEPMATIIRSTGAKSLQFECIFTVTEALPHTRREDGTETANAAAVVRLCSDYLRGFVEDSDQNLKYLGLVGLANLMKSSPRSVVEHRDLVLLCLGDEDVTIRKKALELLAGIVSRKSLVELVRHLMEVSSHRHDANPAATRTDDVFLLAARAPLRGLIPRRGRGHHHAHVPQGQVRAGGRLRLVRAHAAAAGRRAGREPRRAGGRPAHRDRAARGHGAPLRGGRHGVSTAGRQAGAGPGASYRRRGPARRRVDRGRVLGHRHDDRRR